MKARRGSSSRPAPKKLSYVVYNKLVGDADDGKTLPPEQIEELLDKYHSSWSNRLYVHWAAVQQHPQDGGAAAAVVVKECVRVKGPCMCFCGHNFKTHEWWNERGCPCRSPGCVCGTFEYWPRQGSWCLMCSRCKHSPLEHGGKRDGKCSKCVCEQFYSSYACMCGLPWGDHRTVVETAESRRATGKPVDNDVVEQRLRAERKSQQSRCNCVGCKCMMPCRRGKKYGKMEPVGDLTVPTFENRSAVATASSKAT